MFEATETEAVPLTWMKVHGLLNGLLTDNSGVSKVSLSWNSLAHPVQEQDFILMQDKRLYLHLSRALGMVTSTLTDYDSMEPLQNELRQSSDDFRQNSHMAPLFRDTSLFCSMPRWSVAILTCSRQKYKWSLGGLAQLVSLPKALRQNLFSDFSSVLWWRTQTRTPPSSNMEHCLWYTQRLQQVLT